MEPPPGERQLVQKFQAGDTSAFESLMVHYEPYILGLLWRITGDRTTAEDLCQDSFLKVLKGLHSFRFQSSFKTWIFRIAHNTATDFLRGRRPESEHDDGTALEEIPAYPGAADPIRAIEESQIRNALHRSVQALPRYQREVIHLFYWDELSVDEISKAMGMPEGTVKTHLFRGRHALRTGALATLAARGAP
jgi:RNA polymerase sigma-70 factor (ECF subfamily)